MNRAQGISIHAIAHLVNLDPLLTDVFVDLIPENSPSTCPSDRVVCCCSDT